MRLCCSGIFLAAKLVAPPQVTAVPLSLGYGPITESPPMP